MQTHSAAFATAMKDSQRVEYLRGTVGAVPFTNSNILSASYSNACTDTKDVKFGSARIGQLNIAFHGLAVGWNEWRGKVIDLEYGLQLADESVEYIPVGKFTIAKADHTDSGVTVTAYDCLSALDIAFTASTTAGQIYDFLEFIEDNTGIVNGRTQADCENLPNGTEILGLYPENDIKTFRDFASWVASSVGGFVTASRTGQLLIKSFNESDIVDTFQSRDRVVGSVFSDYVTQYRGINVTSVFDGTVDYVDGDDQTGGASISLGSNPLLQYGTDLAKATQRKAIANVAVGIAYTPFNIAILNCPVYDLGDLVVCEGGVAGSESLTCCVMGIEWSFKNTTTLKGFGADPNLSSGKSATDKALGGVSSKAKSNELVTHTYINSLEYALANHAVSAAVVSIDFATVNPSKVTMLHEINFDLTLIDSKATITAYYYLNERLQGYRPVGTFNENGKHILTLMYFLENLVEGTAYEWRVRLKIDGGTATISRNHIHAWLQGQGLVAVDEFAGTIRVEDTYTPLELNRAVVTVVDTVNNLDINALDQDFQPVDNYNLSGTGDKDLATIYCQDMNIELAYIVYALCDDSGDFALCDDNGDFVIVNSDGGFT